MPTLPKLSQLHGRARFAGAFAYALAAVAASVWFLEDAFIPRLVVALKSGGGDCVINWLGARAWRLHLDPYSKVGLKWAGLSVFGHPPTTPLWYLPFTNYDIYDLTQTAGHFLIFMLLVHLVLVAAELRVPQPLVTAFLAFAVVMDAQWWVYHVTMLQLSEPIALLYVLAWILLRRDHEIGAGIVLGLACSMKLYAGLLVLLLLVGRRWRGVAAAVAVYLAFAVTATMRFGVACWGEYLPMMRDTQHAVVSSVHNASLQGLLVRNWPVGLMLRGDWISRAMLTGTAISLLLIAGMCWLVRHEVTRKPGPPPIDDAVDLPFALFTTASVWLNPVAWEHYNVTLLAPLAVALFAVWRMPARTPVARIAWIAAITALLVYVGWLLSINMYDKNNLPPGASRWPVTENWLPWPLTMAALALLVWRRRQVSAAAGGRPA